MRLFLLMLSFSRPEDDLEQAVMGLKDTGRINDDETENNSSVKMAGSTLRVLWPMTKFWPLPMMPRPAPGGGVWAHGVAEQIGLRLCVGVAYTSLNSIAGDLQ